jgi:hypothetical protein
LISEDFQYHLGHLFPVSFSTFLGNDLGDDFGEENATTLVKQKPELDALRRKWLLASLSDF